MKERILILADVQAGNLVQFGKPWEPGLNTRMQYIIEALKQVQQIVINDFNERGVRTVLVIIAGDLFSQGGYIDTPVFNLVHKSLVQLGGSVKSTCSGGEVLVIPGNHDMPLRTNHYATDTFSSSIEGVRAIRKPVVIETDVAKVFAVPFSYSDKVMAKWFAGVSLEASQSKGRKILVSHCDIKGARIGPAHYSLKSALHVDDLYPLAYDAVLLGHNHIKQKLADNVWSIGSFIQHDFGESDDKACLVSVYRTKSGIRLAHQELEAPKFVTISRDDFKKKETPALTRGNYVRIVTDRVLSIEELTEIVSVLKPLDYRVHPVSVEGKEGKERTRSSHIIECISLLDKFGTYLTAVRQTVKRLGLKVSRVRKLGRIAIKEARRVGK